MAKTAQTFVKIAKITAKSSGQKTIIQPVKLRI